ncbi:unnamed protein product, partial [marine sediment metagenome]
RFPPCEISFKFNQSSSTYFISKYYKKNGI